MKQRKPSGLTCCLTVLLASIAIDARAVPPSIVVNSTADTVANDGICTLREAITAANTNTASGAAAGECAAGSAAPAVDTIAFAIPGTDPGCAGTPKLCTIKPATTLPAIIEPIFFDGYTQPSSHANTLAVGDDAAILIELDASNLVQAFYLDGTPVSGGASGSTIRGIALTHAIPPGSSIRGTHLSGLTVAGNFLGTDASGMSGTATARALYVDYSSNIVVGGATPADRNIIVAPSNNEGLFIEVSNGCTVQGNYIGTDRTGLAGIPVFNGIHLGQTSNCQVGGSSGAGNVIGEIQNIGIQTNIEALGGAASNNIIQGNLIGTDATGTVRLGQGIGVNISGDDNKIGGTGSGEGNLISGNGSDGILITGSPTGVLVEGNKIGTDITGTRPLGNGACGIEVFASSDSATIGGAVSGTKNVIAYSGANGIGVGGSNTVTTIEGNEIHDNGSLGISLNGCAGTTPRPNVANGPQNYPVITAVTIGPKTTGHVSGTLNGTADTTFRVEFFANAACDASGNGEGKVFVGFADVTTIGNDATFGPFDITVPACRHVVTATATDPAGNTSEFSKCSDQDSMFTECFDGD